MLTQFQTYPFEKLSKLLEGLTPPTQEVVNLTIGEPRFQTPTPIQDALKAHTSLLQKYPKSKGENYLKDAQLHFIQERFSLTLTPNQIIPTFGTREVLFNFPQFLLFGEKNPCMAYPNPFYQIYEGSALACRAKVFLMPLREDNRFKPSLTKEQLQEVQLVILNSPNNPTGAILSLEELREWVRLSLQYNFIILSDECYSEIYEDVPPYSILQASQLEGNANFKNILALNSISKRSSAPGLRSGFIAGDEKILKAYGLYRTYCGCAIPLPLQEASSVAWRLSSENTRKIYAKNLKIAKEIFSDTPISPYSFYVWLKVGDELEFCKTLYQKEGIMLLPGSFLGREGEGSGFVRIALVYEENIIQKALHTIKSYLKA